MKVLILIPARYGSTRFPGKPLAMILGKSMIQRVYENTSSSGFDTFVVTDDDRIEEHVKGFGGQVAMVKDDVPSGSERINLAYQRYFADGGYDLIINVQGDEPLLPGTEISRLASFHLNKGFNIATVVREKRDLTSDSFNDPNHVKVIYSKESSKCHYFSRAPIPFKRKRDQNDKDEKWFLHIGIYSYRPKALSSFCSSKRSRYESLEELEQLRALELGMSIGAIESDCNLMGVDLPEDIKKIEGVLSGEDN